MSKKLENVKVDKYYADENSVMRVDGFDCLGYPTGVMVSFFDGFFFASYDTDLHHFDDEDNKIKEISKEEFEQKLEEGQKHLVELYKTIKK